MSRKNSPFAFPHTVSGWMRGSHMGPLMPAVQEKLESRWEDI